MLRTVLSKSGGGVDWDRVSIGVVKFSNGRSVRKCGLRELELTVSSKVRDNSPLSRSR